MADGGGRQGSVPDEDILEQVVAFDQADGVRAPRKARAHQQGDDHTQQGDPEAGPACCFSAPARPSPYRRRTSAPQHPAR